MKATKYMTIWMTGILLTCSLLSSESAMAASELDVKKQEASHVYPHEHHHKKLTQEQIQQMRLEKLQRLAAYFGIDTEGKSLNQLKDEVDQAKKASPEKWEAFKQEFRAKKLEKIREYAKSKGVETEGKSLEQLHDELHELEEQVNHAE